jgi:hypothetical protein
LTNCACAAPQVKRLVAIATKTRLFAMPSTHLLVVLCSAAEA